MTADVRRYRVAQLLLLATLLGLWQGAVAVDLASDRLLVAPVDVADALSQLLRRAYFYENLWATLRVIGLGMGIALVTGVGLALAVGVTPAVRDGVYPFVVALNVLPKVALVPLITVSMGYSYNSRVVVVVLSAFFPMFINTLVALREAQEPRDRLMRSLGATRLQRLRMHVLPEGAPVILAGIKLSLTVAFISAILAELLIQRDGLAYLITAFRITLNTEMMYAVTVAVGVLGMVMYFAVERLERWVVHWEPLDRPAEAGAHA